MGIYDLRGRSVRAIVEQKQTKATHSVTWDGKDSQGHVVATGIYFIRLQVGDQAVTRKVVLIR